MNSTAPFHRISEMQGPVMVLATLIVTFCEFRFPLRALYPLSWKHLFRNYSLALINFIFLGCFSFAMVEWTVKCLYSGTGLMNYFQCYGVISIIAQILAYDFFNYIVHRVFHEFDPLWYLHRVHHSDLDMNSSTAFRFHPIEGFIRMALEASFITAIGMHPYALIGYSLIAIPLFLISHANLKLPEAALRYLGWLFVLGPDHHVHHLPKRSDHDNNYGTLFIIWDQLFLSYKSLSQIPLGTAARCGLYGYPEEPCSLQDMLVDPWLDTQLPSEPSSKKPFSHFNKI